MSNSLSFWLHVILAILLIVALILAAWSWYLTKSSEPSKEDYDKAHRLIMYAVVALAAALAIAAYLVWNLYKQRPTVKMIPVSAPSSPLQIERPVEYVQEDSVPLTPSSSYVPEVSDLP